MLFGKSERGKDQDCQRNRADLMISSLMNAVSFACNLPPFEGIDLRDAHVALTLGRSHVL